MKILTFANHLIVGPVCPVTITVHVFHHPCSIELALPEKSKVAFFANLLVPGAIDIFASAFEKILFYETSVDVITLSNHSYAPA